MEKEKLRAKALKMYAELMVQKIKEVDGRNPGLEPIGLVRRKTSMAESIITSTRYFFRL